MKEIPLAVAGMNWLSAKNTQKTNTSEYYRMAIFV
jgi:hypothetical protein